MKNFKDVLVPGIVHVINLCISNSYYPEAWKVGLVSPIPKKGDLTSPSNWRPVVLNAVLSKILEKVMNQQIDRYMCTNLLNSPYQHAYKQKVHVIGL